MTRPALAVRAGRVSDGGAPGPSLGRLRKPPATYTSVWNPSQPLARFAVQFEVMTPSERRILEAFWALVGGPVGSFSLTDDAGVTHTDCHFEADSLQLQYLSAAHCAVQFTIVALN